MNEGLASALNILEYGCDWGSYDAEVAAVTALIEHAEKIIEAGPFYNGVDDDFCAVCRAYFLMGEDHKDDCAYVLLKRMLRPD